MTTTVMAGPDEAVDPGAIKAAGAPRRSRARQFAGLAAAATLTILGAASVVKGVDGRATVRDALTQEHIVGTPGFTPAAIAAKAREAGLRGVPLPECSVAGKPITDGESARCFAEYMRVDALVGTQGATYAQMPRFASKDGKGTNDAAAALTSPSGEPTSNPARQLWVTETALSTALNTSYMAEQISLFGIAVGVGFLLIGLTLAVAVVRRHPPAKATPAT
jgi:hypothetical protein